MAATFANPVHQAPLADPFVLRYDDRYFAYGTPDAPGHVPVLTSVDLVRWEPAGDALRPTTSADEWHWAPEVAEQAGRFYMYVSSGGPAGEGHQLRVAVSDSPLGPFELEPGVLVPEEEFTIDAHPFRDVDGSWYLFYCRDFLDDGMAGTGIVVDRLETMTQLAGSPRVVVRPHADWHVFEQQRSWRGGVRDWYTVEGPSAIRRDGRYWCFFSGGAWEQPNYGVSAAVADHPLGPYVPNETGSGADVLRTAPGAVGPGHASLVCAPDGVTRYLVYHAWDGARTARRMFLDRLRWSDGRPAASGPTVGPQPYPPTRQA